MEQEIWKVIYGYEDYEISNMGNVISNKTKKPKLLKPQITGDKFRNNTYLSVGLHKKGQSQKMVQIHRIVAEMFKEHTYIKGMCIDHINGNRFDNRSVNLQVCTHRLNITKDRCNRLSKYVGVTLNKTSMKWLAHIQINFKKIYLGTFSIEAEAGQAYQDALNKIKQ